MIALLLIHQVGVLIAGLWGMAWGAVSVLVVGGVTFFSVRLAKSGGRSSAWFLLPTLLFTVLPLLILLWKILWQKSGRLPFSPITDTTLSLVSDSDPVHCFDQPWRFPA